MPPVDISSILCHYRGSEQHFHPQEHQAMQLRHRHMPRVKLTDAVFVWFVSPTATHWPTGENLGSLQTLIQKELNPVDWDGHLLAFFQHDKKACETREEKKRVIVDGHIMTIDVVDRADVDMENAETIEAVRKSKTNTLGSTTAMNDQAAVLIRMLISYIQQFCRQEYRGFYGVRVIRTHQRRYSCQ